MTLINTWTLTWSLGFSSRIHSLPSTARALAHFSKWQFAKRQRRTRRSNLAYAANMGAIRHPSRSLRRSALTTSPVPRPDFRSLNSAPRIHLLHEGLLLIKQKQCSLYSAPHNAVAAQTTLARTL